MSKMKIWWHGTNEAAARKILVEGFRPGAYFAEHLEDALEFGGLWVLEVALDYSPIMPGNWQMKVPDAVPVSAILNLYRYRIERIAEYQDRKDAAFPNCVGQVPTSVQKAADGQ